MRIWVLGFLIFSDSHLDDHELYSSPFICLCCPHCVVQNLKCEQNHCPRCVVQKVPATKPNFCKLPNTVSATFPTRKSLAVLTAEFQLFNITIPLERLCNFSVTANSKPGTMVDQSRLKLCRIVNMN